MYKSVQVESQLKATIREKSLILFTHFEVSPGAVGVRSLPNRQLSLPTLSTRRMGLCTGVAFNLRVEWSHKRYRELEGKEN